MTPEEQQLIGGLFERMRALGPIEKDRDAESYIMQSVLATPDSAYKLVQSVLVQEQALEEATLRIQDLEQRIQQLEQGGQQPARASGGFLGGLFGGSKPSQPPPPQPSRPMAVPAAGSRPYAPQQASTPWGNQGQQPMYQQPAQNTGGGFMKTAMVTAAGVAGGMLVAGAIGNMLGGGPAKAATGTEGHGLGSAENTLTDEPRQQEVAAQDPGNYDDNTSGAPDDGGGWFGGNDSGDSEF